MEQVISLHNFKWDQSGAPRLPASDPKALPTGPSTALRAAVWQLETLVHGAFKDGTATALITTGLNKMEDARAAGISGNYTKRNGAKVKWTIRWDYDPEKGCHVNLSITDGSAATAKWAICDDLIKVFDASYQSAIEKFSSNIEYKKEDATNLAKRQECAVKGHTLWKSATGCATWTFAAGS